MTEHDNDLLAIFWDEVGEYLRALNDALLKVEMSSGADRQGLLREMNRLAHSMKGAARAVGLTTIESIAHQMETVFSACLQGTLALSPEAADALYDGLDVIQNLASGETVSEEIVRAVTASLADLLPPEPDERKATATVPAAEADQPPPTGEESIRVAVRKLDRLMADAGELLVMRMRGEVQQGRLQELQSQHARWQREWRAVRAAYIRLARRAQAGDDDAGDIDPDLAAVFRFLEANARHLLEANRELTRISQESAQHRLQLGMLADQMQQDVAALRMMPFETISGGMQRMVRDLAREMGKAVRFEIHGGHVEIDKNVLEALKEALMHLLRNAVDHGLETPDERRAAGKPEEGHIALEVEQQGSEITITTADDGRGLDTTRIRDRAVDAGLVTRQQADALGDAEARQLIFAPGFTTTDHVTALSGRGLGMEIARRRVEQMRGRIHADVHPGGGTRITIRVPVSLTRMRMVLLRTGGETYAVPSLAVTRMERVTPEACFTAEGRRMVRLGGRAMRLVSLADLLRVPAQSQDADSLQVLVLQATDRTAAFAVDHLENEMEALLKPLGPELAGLPLVAGAALMGSGEVVIVLDVNELVRAGEGVPGGVSRAPARTESPGERVPLRVLVVDDSITTRTLEKNILETAGCAVTVAIDGDEAWRYLLEQRFDVVVSDVEMPAMDGLELTRRIKGDDRLRDLPVILLTSLSRPEQREAGLAAGADAYLVKSRFDQGELLSVIRSVAGSGA